MQPIKLGINMKLIHKHYSNDENFYNLNPLQSAVKFGIISLQSKKTIAEPGNSTYLQLAQSTPKACFFMRNIRTPQNKLRILFQHLSTIYSSMVERNEPSLTGCLPVMAVSHLVTLYRPTVRSLAVDSENLSQDTAEMIYKFLCVNRTQSHFNLCVISLNSTTEEQARLSLSADYRFIAVVARINPQNNRTLAVLPTLSVSALQEITSFNQFAERNQVERMKVSDLKALRNESEMLCESIEYGLMHLGDLMQTLGNLADTEQDFTREAMSNDNVKHIGGLIKANAYLLNALRETAELSDYYIPENKGVEG